jgi:hypothetical protein
MLRAEEAKSEAVNTVHGGHEPLVSKKQVRKKPGIAVCYDTDVVCALSD